MDKVRVLKHHAFQEVTADLLNSIGSTLFGMSDGIAQAFIAGFNNTDHLIFRDLVVTPDGSNLAVSCGLQGVFLYRTDAETSIWGVYKGTRPDKNTPYSEEILTFAAADPLNPRIDIIEAEIVEEDDADYFETVQLFNPSTETSYAQNKYTKKVRNVKLYVKTGTASVTPVAPSATVGRFTLREVTIQAAATSLSAPDIVAQAWDAYYSQWTINHGVIVFPAIYEMLNYIKTELSKARRTIFSESGVYQFVVPEFRTQLYFRIASGGGGGSAAVVTINTNQPGQDGQPSYVRDIATSVEIVRVLGGEGSKVFGGILQPGRGVRQFIFGNNGDAPLRWAFDGANNDGRLGGVGGSFVAPLNINNRFTRVNSINLQATSPHGEMVCYMGAGTNNFYSVDPLKRIKQHEEITVDNYGESLVFIGNTRFFGQYARIQKWLPSGATPITLAGDPNNSVQGVVDGLPGVNRVTDPRNFIVDPNDSNLILFLDFAVTDHSIRRVNVTTGAIVTEIPQSEWAPSEYPQSFALDPLFPNSLLICLTQSGNAKMIRFNLTTRAQTVVIPYHAYTGSAVDNPVATATLGVVSVKQCYYFPNNDRLYFFDRRLVGSAPLGARQRFISNYSTLVGSVVSTDYTFGGQILTSSLYNPVDGKIYLSTTDTTVSPSNANIWKGDMLLNNPSFPFPPWFQSNPTIHPTVAVFVDRYGRNGGGGCGGTSPTNGEFGGAGGASNLIEGTFDVQPGQTLEVVVGAGGAGGVTGDPNFDGGAGGDGFVEISW